MAKKTTTKSNAKRYEQQWDVPSESDPSAYYTVSLTQEQQLICWSLLAVFADAPAVQAHQTRAARRDCAPRSAAGRAVDASPGRDNARYIR